MAKNFEPVMCNSCGTVYMGVPPTHIKNEQIKFLKMYWAAYPKIRETWPTYMLGSSQTCWCSNDYKNFRLAKDQEIPEGATLDEILHFKF